MPDSLDDEPQRDAADSDLYCGYPYESELCPYDQYRSSGRTSRRERSYPAAQGTPPSGALRVIHVSSMMVPAGIDKWLTGLIRHADPRRLKFVRCVVTSEHVDWKQLVRVGVPVEIGGRDSVRRASEDCDVLLISDPGPNPNWVDDVRAKLCVIVAHGDGPWTRDRLECMAPVVHHVVAVSPRVQQAVCNGFPCTVIPNGVDPLHLTRSRPRDVVRASLGFRPGDFVLGFVGRFSPEKNPFAVIEAVARLPLHFKALMVGFGSLRDEVIDRANELIPSRFTVVRGEDHVGDLYAAMDAFCLASHSEGYGLVIMEAMMCGKPVIVGRVGFVPEAIADRVNGVVVPGDAGSISEAAALLDAYPEWAATLGREAARYAERHGYASTMAERYADLLDSLWSARAANPSSG
ncbi:MAG: glycosyltransferase family 4 protein [Isosphaeraceae bacterium]|nr:glycosyltransferase family 4 protein [Isosphaeraceae bacterium]